MVDGMWEGPSIANCNATVCLSVTPTAADITDTATKTFHEEIKEISSNNKFYVHAGPLLFTGVDDAAAFA